MKALNSFGSKTVAPFDYSILARPKFIGYLIDRHSVKKLHYYAGAFNKTPFETFAVSPLCKS